MILQTVLTSLLTCHVLSLSFPDTDTADYTPSALGFGCQSMCCEGKNNTCYSTGVRINGRGSISSKCFCDEGCPDMGDCCFDYDKACPVVNCQVGNWTSWSECSTECGVGTKSRGRVILVKPRFGGEQCPRDLVEKTICNGDKCVDELQEEEELEKETAKIMPARYGRFRNLKRYNANMDIRKNLFHQYYEKDVKQHTGYCSRFRVVSSRRACITSYITPWATVLKPEAIICVECQQTAMEKELKNGICAGHGEVGVSTSWNAVTASRCTGWWERIEDGEECSCSEESHKFIFV